MSSALAISLPLHGGETGEQGEEVTREKMVELGVGGTREAKGAMNPTLVMPPLVVRLMQSLLPRAHIDMNSLTDVTRNCELVLAVIIL